MSSKRFYHFSSGLLFITFLISGLVISSHAQTPTPTPQEDVPTTTREEIVPPEPAPSILPSPQPSPPPPPVAPDLTKLTDADLIHFGDLIDVDVVGSTENDWRGSLTPEGFLTGINYLEEPIQALCRTEAEVAAEIARGLSSVLREPQVIVRILDRSKRPVSLLFGAVRTPFRFRILRPVRLNELLILSGGLTERASGEIQIFRPPKLSCRPRIDEAIAAAARAGGRTEQPPAATDDEPPEKFIAASQNADSQFLKIKIGDLLKGSTDANPFILSGDVVTVREAEPIYVIGGVLNPKQINAQTEMTLSRAITAAGGLTKNADPRNVTIFRREGGGVKTIEVDFEKVKSGAAEDVVLRSLDVVDVAQSGREKRKFPPIINVESKNERSGSSAFAAQPPLRIID